MLASLIRILFPERCIGCTKPGRAICARCLARLPHAIDLPFGTFAVFDYGNSLVRAAVRTLKYHHQSEAGRILAQKAVPHIQEYVSEHFIGTPQSNCVFVPVPEHSKKLRSKGFNQSVLLARWWSQAVPKSTVRHLLTKAVFTLPQAKLNRTQRLKNVVGTMEATENLDPETLYIVVDDVTTTGATLTEAVRALRASGAKIILSIALAHGYAK